MVVAHPNSLLITFPAGSLGTILQAIWNGESVTAAMAAKKAGLSLQAVLYVGGAEKVATDAATIKQLEQIHLAGGVVTLS